MIFNIVTIAICITLILAFRQLDKKDKSIEKVRKYSEKIIGDFEAYFTQKKDNLKEASLEIDTKQSHALASVKRLDSIIEEFNKKIAAQTSLVKTLEQLEQKTAHYDALIKELLEMSERVEENLMKIKAESAFIAKTQDKVHALKKQQDYLEKRIPQLEKEFAAENEASLDALTKGLLDTFHKDIETIEISTRDALMQNEKILTEINQSYEDAFAVASERADTIEGKAFDKLRNKAIERVEKANTFLEEKIGFLNMTIKTKIDETQSLIHSFNDNWRNEAEENLRTMSLDLKKIQNEYEKTAEEIEKSLTESKESFGSVKKSLDEGFSIFQNEIEGKFLSFTNTYQSLLDTFSDDFSFKSESLEKGIADIDVIKQSLENSLKEISAKVLGDFSDFTDEQASSLQKHEENFANQMSLISTTIRGLENELQELKQRAYDNVSEKLSGFEDSFLEDLTKQSQRLNDSLENWQNAFDAKLENLSLEYSDQRKVLENKYTEELKEKIQAIQERFTNYSNTLENSFEEKNKKYQADFLGLDEKLVLFIGEYKEAFEKTRIEADAYVKNEITHFIGSIDEQIKRYEKDVAQSLEKMTDDISDSSQQAAALLDSIRTDFSEWKERMNTQFVEVKTIFDDKYASFSEDAQNVLVDLERMLKDAVSTSSESALEQIRELEEKIEAISNETESVIQHYNKHSNDIVDDFKAMYKEMLEETERKIKTQKAEVEEQLRQEKKIIQDIKLTNETSQEKMILKMQKDSDELNTSLDTIDRKIKQFIAQTQIFEKADVLKLDLEEKISEMKTETAQLMQYEKMIQALEKQVEKLKKSEEEVNQRVLNFNQEKKRIDDMEKNFNELVILSASIDQKVEGLKTTNDDLLIMQGDVRNYQSTIKEIANKIERLEKKEPILEQTIKGIDSTFKMLDDLEKRLQSCEAESADLPDLLQALKMDVDGLIKLNPKIKDVLDQADSLDEILSTTEERFDAIQDSKHWLASTESRLNEINKETKSYLKLLGEVKKSPGVRDSRSSQGLVLETRENVIKLARLGWTPAKIAERLNISQGEVELILETQGE
jgi:DNA repair exonuclease SbcCD ATPase subunit